MFEPEHRLILMIPYVVFVVAGYGGWATATKDHTHWMVPVICYGLINFGQKMLVRNDSPPVCADANRTE